MKLTPQQQSSLARRACWYFDCYFGVPGDSVVFTGEGVADLDSLIDRLTFNGTTNFARNQRFLCDVGSQYSEWRPFDVNDVEAIKSYYIAFWGDVNRPNVYQAGSEAAIPVYVPSSYNGSGPEISIE